MAEIGKDIQKAAHILMRGGLVAIPTETVYGLAANAFEEEAILKVFKAKNRPAFDPLITHIRSIKAIDPLTQNIGKSARLLMETFWPGPLTLVLEKSDAISDLISSGLSTAAFRIPRHALTRELLNNLDFPLVAPSANPFGYVSPTRPEHVEAQLGTKVDYILDGGPCPVGIESTIVGFDNDTPVVLRLGGLSIEAIEQVVGTVRVNDHSTSNPKAPGMLASHYSPTKKVVIGNIPNRLNTDKNHKIGILSYQEKYPDYTNFVLSEAGDLDEAAKRLFEGLRWLDSQDIDLIISEYVPTHGLGRAINDRLNRAAAH